MSFKQIMAIAAVIVLSASAFADEIIAPDFKLVSNNSVSSTKMPWNSEQDILYHTDKSNYWNMHFRPEIGQISLMPIEYQTYEYNNATDRIDNGEINEYHSDIAFRSSFISNLSFIVQFGYTMVERDSGLDSSESFQKFMGWNYQVGMEFAIPLGKMLTIQVGGNWKQWEAWSGDQSGEGDHMYAHRWNLEARVVFELMGELDTNALSVAAGFGWHSYVERWTVAVTDTSTTPATTTVHTYNISPNNTDSLKRGPEAFDIIAAVYYSPNQYVYVKLEAKFMGPMTLGMSLSFVF